MANIPRRKTVTTLVGGVRVGSDAPIVVQSMTNTDTADISGTVQLVAALPRAGSKRPACRQTSMKISWVTPSDCAGSRRTRLTRPKTRPASRS